MRSVSVDDVEAQRLGVVRDEVGPRSLVAVSGGPAGDDDLLLGERDAPVLDRDPRLPLRRRELALAPGDDDPFELHRRGGNRLVDHVDALEQVPELVLPEHLLEAGAVRGAEHELGRVALKRQVAAHRRELLGRPRLVGVLTESPAARRRELVHVLEDAFQGAVLGDELAGGLVSDARDSRDVVGAVPLEPDEIRHLLRRHAVAREDPFRRVDVDVRDSARGHHQRDVLGDELEGVAVRRDHSRLDPGLVRPRGERSDDVVGLPALELEVLVAESLDDRAKVRELLGEEIRHRPAIHLVLGVELFAVRGARVPRDGDALRPVVGEQLEEHVRKAEQRVGREALARRELLRQREVRAVGEVVSVDEEELGVPRRAVVELELSPCQRLR
jgi:hypothetical protein